MKASTQLAFIAAVSLACGACQDEAPPASNVSTLEQHVDSIVGPLVTQAAIAGLSVGVAQEGKIVLSKAYGFADIEQRIPLDRDALFPIASVTKTLTAIAILQLVDDGLVALDDDITQYLDFDTGEHTVTIRQLLNHTSGIKDYTESDIPEQMREDGYSSETLMRLLQDKDFDFAPGEGAPEKQEMREFHNVTAVEFAERFQEPHMINEAAIAAIGEHTGQSM